MKNFLAAALLAGAATMGSMIAATPAEAAGGCGRGFHRTPAGFCRANFGNRAFVGPGRVVVPGRLIVGRYYGNRGYWNGRRYYQNRYRIRGGGWRYR